MSERINILSQADEQVPHIRNWQPCAMGEGVLDESTFHAIEVDQLFESINHARTTAGQSVLYRSLTDPLADAEAVREKQAAVQELVDKPELRQQLDKLVDTAAKDEAKFYELLFHSFLGFFGNPRQPNESEGYGYDAYIKGTRFVLDACHSSQQLPEISSRYLLRQVEALQNFATSRAYALMKGPAYCTESGMKIREEKSSWIPAIRFEPTLFKPVFIALMVMIAVLLVQLNPFEDMGIGVSASSLPVLSVILLPAAMLYMPVVGGFDLEGCIYPLRKIFRESDAVSDHLEALGRLDELLSFLRYAEAHSRALILPKILDAEQHTVRLSAVRNPILVKQNPNYVGNDIKLDRNRLTFITGPNSGGKTAFCKTLAQVQLLTQVGCYVPAEQAELSIADRIFYQVPEVSHLADDGEGRFGTELKRTKAMFMAASPRSLVVLDELSEGTTHEEKLQTSYAILEGFYNIGNNTILITHNHELVEAFQAKQIGLCRQVEFINDEPSYKLVSGISRVSHADRVVRKIGFSKEDMDAHLSKQGWLKN